MHFKRKILLVLEKIILLFPAPKTPYEPIFISGCPRSGTTVSFQLVVEHFNLCYFTNYDKKYRFHPILNHSFLFKISNDYSSDFNSHYGDITGMAAPSDAWGVFHRMFPYYFNPKKNKKLGELKKTIHWLQYFYKKPLVVKNNANSLRIKELYELFPNALFVHIDRDRYKTVASILKGMEKNNIGEQIFWGTGPDKELVSHTFSDQIEKAVFQYEFVKEYIHQVGKENVSINLITIDYPREVKDLTILKNISDAYPGVLSLRKWNKTNQNSFFKPSKNQVSEDLRRRIDSYVDKVNAMAVDILKNHFHDG